MFAQPTMHHLPMPTGNLVLRPAHHNESRYDNASPTLPDYPPVDVFRRASHEEILYNLQKQAMHPSSPSTAEQQRLRFAIERREKKARSRHTQRKRSSSGRDRAKPVTGATGIEHTDSIIDNGAQVTHAEHGGASQEVDIALLDEPLERLEEPLTAVPNRLFSDDFGGAGGATATYTPAYPLTPVAMDLGALAMIASLPDPILTPIHRPSRRLRLEKGAPLTPHTKVRLKSGSIMAIITPEQSCWQRARYTAGQIMLSHEFLLPTMMMTDMDALACFIGAANNMPIVETIIQSDDVVLDGIVDYFSTFGLVDVKPFTAHTPSAITTTDSNQFTPLPALTEVAEENERDSERWSGSTGWSGTSTGNNVRETISSVDEIMNRDSLPQRPNTLELLNQPGSRNSNASTLSNLTRASDRASTLPETWVSKHSPRGSYERPLSTARHSGIGILPERGQVRTRKSAPARRNPGRMSFRRFLASAGSIV